MLKCRLIPLEGGLVSLMLQLRCAGKAFSESLSPLYLRLSNIKVFLVWVFPSASCLIINMETTVSFKQINPLGLSLKSWHSTNTSMPWSLLPMVQLCMYERARLTASVKALAWYHFEAFKICLCALYFLHIIFTEGCIKSKTRQILSYDLACALIVCQSEPEKGLYLKRWTGGSSIRFGRAGSWSHNHLSHQPHEIHQKHLPLPSHPFPCEPCPVCYPSQNMLFVSLSPPSYVTKCTNPHFQAL